MFLYNNNIIIRKCTEIGHIFMGDEDGMRSPKSLPIYSRRIYLHNSYIVFFFSTSIAGKYVR